MPSIFERGTVTQAGMRQDPVRLSEMDTHQLLADDDGKNPIATFEQVKQIGRVFLNLQFDTKPFLTSPLAPPHQLTALSPHLLIQQHQLAGKGAFWGKLALGADSESHFPVTIEVISTPQGNDLRLHIVPIHYGALEVAQFGQHTDSLLALAAAAAVAPQFLLALEGGITTQHCETKREIVTSITPDHGLPLAVTFDAFGQGTKTLDRAISITGNSDISIRQAAHFHGQARPNTQYVSQAAGDSKIAAGVPIRSMLQSQLPRHALYIQTAIDSLGNQQIVSVNESLQNALLDPLGMPLLSAALGFTARVVGDSGREKTVEGILRPGNADIPLAEVVKK